MVTRALLALLVAGTLAACGGGGSGGDDQIATLGEENAAGDDTTDDDTTSGDDGDGELTEAEREDAMLEFTECMREHGVDMPDPSSSGGGGAVIIGGKESNANAAGDRGGPMDDAAFEEAHEACQGILEDAFGERPQLSPEEQAERQDQMLAFTECMREHGIDMPDPQFDEDGGFSVHRAEEGETGQGPMPDEEAFEEAQEACEDELGFEDGPGGPMMRTEGGPKGGSS